MISARYIILEHICPALGMLLSNLMFSAPFRSVKEAVTRGSLGHLNVTPFAFMTGNCIGWIVYSMLVNNLYIFFANAPGLVLSIWLNLCATKLQFSDFRVREVRQSVVRYLEEGSERRLEARVDKQDDRPISQKAVDFGRIVLDVTAQKRKAPAAHENIVVVMVVIWMAIISLVQFANTMSSSTRELIVGLLVNANLLFFYGAPLSTLLTVLKARNSASIHILTMLTNTANGAFWAAYGFAVRDPFVYTPNSLGAALGVVQICLVLTFPRVSVEDGEKGSDEIDDDSDDDLDDLESFERQYCDELTTGVPKQRSNETLTTEEETA